MPKVLERTGSDYSLIVWESTEPMEELLEKAGLNNEEKAKLESFISHSRKREWLTVRKVLKLLNPGSSAIIYDDFGKPCLSEKIISISHSHTMIALMMTESSKVGIDIEIIGQRIEKLATKFLSDEENTFADNPKRIEKLHVLWGAKEALYKIHGIGNVEFSKDLFVYPFHYSGSGEIKAAIRKKGFEKEYEVHYQKTGDYMLSWCIET